MYGYLGCACESNKVNLSGLGAFGISQAGASTASNIAKGASVGQKVIPIPGVGAAIGATVVAVAAAFRHIFGNHDVRTSGADKANCRNMLNQYLQLAAQAGGVIGNQVPLSQLDQMHFCLATLYGDPIYNVDPRYFSVDITQADALAKQLANAAKSQAPGSSFTTSAVTGKSTDGRASGVFTYGPQTVTLPNPPSVQGLAQILRQLMNDNCAHRNKNPNNCPAYWNNPGFTQLAVDLIANALGAATLATGPTTPLAPTSPIAVSTPAVGTAISPQPATGATPAGVDLNAMVSQLLAQGASQQQAYSAALQNLQAAGVPATPAVQQQVASAVQAGGVTGLPKWALYGAAAVALVFALARPHR